MTIWHWHLTRGGHADDGPGTPVGRGPAGVAAGPDAAGARAGRRLGVIGLALVLIAAMDSIRNLPTARSRSPAGRRDSRWWSERGWPVPSSPSSLGSSPRLTCPRRERSLTSR
jgi:hypothetical protein